MYFRMDYADRLDFMDDDCDIEGFPIEVNKCLTCHYYKAGICQCEKSDNRFDRVAMISCKHYKHLKEG